MTQEIFDEIKKKVQNSEELLTKLLLELKTQPLQRFVPNHKSRNVPNIPFGFYILLDNSNLHILGTYDYLNYFIIFDYNTSNKIHGHIFLDIFDPDFEDLLKFIKATI